MQLSAAWLAGGRAPSPRRLDGAARAAGLLVFFTVAARMTPPRAGVQRHGRLNPPNARERRVIGARLRKLLRGRDFATRLRAILAVVRDLETHVARLMRRLRHGLTRLRVIDPLACAEACAPRIAASVALADSS
ncbi:MAG: hypothetical protein AB7O98_01415 [Hyphomonadaceae bacterium]